MDIVRVNINNIIDDFSFIENDDQKMLIYWRNHRKLHEKMDDIYFEKGGYGIFNHKYIRITEDDIKEFYDIDRDEDKKNRIWLSDDDENAEKDFLDIIKDNLKNGYAIYYTSSW